MSLAITLPDGFGHFADARCEGDATILRRDPLGLHKLFYAVDSSGRVDTDAQLHRLRERGHALDAIFAAPPGTLRLGPGGSGFEAPPSLEFATSGAAEDLGGHEATLRSAWQRALKSIVAARGGRPIYVALSGGLDSSLVAALAREHFADLRAITFRLDDGALQEGEDLLAARAVAEHLGLPHREVVESADAVFARLDDVLLHGQDWRDFNVHCALVNASLAAALEGEDAIVLTGDGANELFSDYDAVELDDRTYYGLPQLPRAALRRFLVRGLDSGDREVGVFARWGCAVAQPFLLCAPAYAALPPGVVENRGAKAELVRRLVGGALPANIYARPKVRAQCGREGRPGGTLAAAHRRGLDQDGLLQRFASLLQSSPAACSALIRAGVYRRARR